MASQLSVSMTKRDSCVLPRRWHCLPRAGDQAVGRCTIPVLQRALLASPPAAKHDRIAAHWGSGDFSASVLRSIRSAVSQGPLPLPLARSPALLGLPSPPAVPRHVPRWALRGLADHLNLCGNKWLVSELSVGAPFAGRFGSSLFRGAGQRQICSFISTLRKNHSWKRNTASHFSATSELRAPRGPKGTFQKQSLGLHLLSVHPPWSAWMHRCSCVPCSEVPTESSTCWGTPTCTVPP